MTDIPIEYASLPPAGLSSGELYMRAVSESRDDDNQRLANATGLTLSIIRWMRRTHRIHDLYDSDGQLITKSRRAIEGRGLSAPVRAQQLSEMRDSCGRNPAIAADILARMEDPPKDGLGRLDWLMRHRELGSTAR